jgi:hypothetical protein
VRIDTGSVKVCGGAKKPDRQITVIDSLMKGKFRNHGNIMVCGLAEDCAHAIDGVKGNFKNRQVLPYCSAETQQASRATRSYIIAQRFDDWTIPARSKESCPIVI